MCSSDLTYVDPMPTTAELSEFYREYYKTGQYRQKLDSKVRRARRRIRRVKRRVVGSRFIDVGCNVGFAVEAARQCGFEALGIDIDAVDSNGETAIHRAAYRNRGDAIRFLARKGANIEVWNKENNDGLTPLAIAVGYRRGTFRPNPEAEAAVREVMMAEGISPAEKITLNSR